MPAAPAEVRLNEGGFAHRLGYYAALQSFLTYSFAWTRPDKGLLWWYSTGKPTQDSRLALIAKTWDDDGELLGYLAWLSTLRGVNMAEQTLGRWAKNIDRSPLKLDAEWERRLRSALSSEPWAGGSDPLHLSGGWHIAAPSGGADGVEQNSTDAENSIRLVGVDRDSRTATFVSDVLHGWYSGLVSLGGRLPPLDGMRSWHIDVFVRPIGFMGTYRRSHATGLWFAGPHSHHVVGN